MKQKLENEFTFPGLTREEKLEIKWKSSNKERMKNYYRRIKKWAVDKLGRRCIVCGLVSEYDCVYDFHHEGDNTWKQDTVEKIKQISKWRRENEIPNDIKLICSNCHRIKSFLESQLVYTVK